MTEKFIKRHCEKCEFRIWDHTDGKTLGCGEIDDEGGRYYEPLEEMHLDFCRKGYKK